MVELVTLSAASETSSLDSRIRFVSALMLNMASLTAGSQFSRIDIAAAFLSAGLIDFAKGSTWGTLNLVGEGSGATFTSNFTHVISGFAPSDAIDVAGKAATDHLVWTQNGAKGTLKIEDASNNVLETLTLDGTYKQNEFALGYSGGVDRITTTDNPCYCRGARLLTDRGEVAVEELAIGDLVVTASGDLLPVKWLGHRELDCRRQPDPRAVWPVRVSAGAFGEQLPKRDLWLSPGHCVAAEGVLMPIRVLINGRTIGQIETDRVEYWHVELDRHDILLANGLPAESYLDTGNRTAFVNGGDFLELHPDFEPKEVTETCLPQVKQGPEVERMKAKLIMRAKIAGHVLTSDPDLHILADGNRIDPVRIGKRRFVFVVPAGALAATLVSRTFSPAHVKPGSADTRTLGACVKRSQIDDRDIALDDPALAAEGWNPIERRPGRDDQRWTKGRSKLPPGVRLVVLDTAHDGSYWRQAKDNVVRLFGT